MIVTDWPIERVHPYERNARKIPRSAIDKVALSIKEFSWRQPIVVDEQGIVLVGHVRRLAALQLKLATVPVHVAVGLTPAQCAAYRLMDNRSGEETDWDVQLLAPEFLDLKKLGFDLDLTGFEMPDIIGSLFPGEKKTPKAKEPSDELKFKVIVDCESEQHQTALLAQFKKRGLKCRPLIS